MCSSHAFCLTSNPLNLRLRIRTGLAEHVAGLDDQFLWNTHSTYTDTKALSGFNLLPSPEVAQSYVYRVTSINSELIESALSNEVPVKDAVQPTAVGTAGIR